jgi:hypothetical protein
LEENFNKFYFNRFYKTRNLPIFIKVPEINGKSLLFFLQRIPQQHQQSVQNLQTSDLLHIAPELPVCKNVFGASFAGDMSRTGGQHPLFDSNSFMTKKIASQLGPDWC